MEAEFAAAKRDYVSTDMKLSEIARRHGIKYSSLRYRAMSENWKADRYNSRCGDNRRDRILGLSDKLLDNIEKSIDELDRCIIKTKERTKSVEYDDELKKPVCESVEEKEDIRIIDGMVDKMGLKQLVSTLKDIKDIHVCLTGEETDTDEEAGVIMLGDVDISTLENDGDYSQDDGES